MVRTWLSPQATLRRAAARTATVHELQVGYICREVGRDEKGLDMQLMQRLVLAGIAILLLLTGCASVTPMSVPTVSVNVVGKGLVRFINDPSPNMSSPGSIDCGMVSNGDMRSSCSDDYPFGFVVTLYVFPVSGWQFSHWSGCSDSTDSSVSVVMTRDIACNAHFTVDPTYAFTLSLSQSAITVISGATGDIAANLSRGPNFGGASVILGLVNPPAGISLVATPNPVAGDSSILTIHVDAAVPPGQQYQLAIRAEGTNANNDPVERTAGLTLTVPGTDFNLSLLVPNLSLLPGETGTNTVTISRDIGFTADVVLTVSGLPQDVTATFIPDPVSGTSSQLTLTSQATTPLGTYKITVTGTAGPLVRTSGMTLTITSTQIFEISLPQPSITLEQNAIGAIDIAITRGPDFTSSLISFAASGAPPGTFAKFDPPGPTPGNSKRLILTTQSTASLGTVTMTVVATLDGAGLTRTATLQVTIVPGIQYCPETAVADSYVGPQVQPSIGGTTPLRVDSFSLQRAAKTYLMFDTGAIAPPLDRVELVLSLHSNSGAVEAGDTRVVDVYGITDNNDWVLSTLPETSIEWNNAPKNDLTSPVDFTDWGGGTSNSSRFLGVVRVEPTDQSGTLYRINITDYVRWAIGLNAGYSTFATHDTDGFVTIMLGNRRVYNQSAQDFTEFMDRDVPVQCARPHLEVY